MSVRILIVDDETVARKRVRRLLAGEPDVTVVGDCADGAGAVRAIATERPDIVFLDVQMPELDGFEVVRSIPPAERPAIVFVTAFDRYALRAFDVHAVDYLLKPFTRERFRTALARAREQHARRRQDPRVTALLDDLRGAQRHAARVAVRVGDKFVVVAWRDVDWIEAADNYVTLHVGAKQYLLRETLSALEDQLDPQQFTRVHRSAIVRMDRIAEWHPASHGDAELVLRSGARVTLTRTFRSKVERIIAG
ncbi:MAG TPA: response regulator [Vicinamibacterales bacterium]|nr:response regulator [Vicinamibacterales bacterium]